MFYLNSRHYVTDHKLINNKEGASLNHWPILKQRLPVRSPVKCTLWIVCCCSFHFHQGSACFGRCDDWDALGWFSTAVGLLSQKDRSCSWQPVVAFVTNGETFYVKDKMHFYQKKISPDKNKRIWSLESRIWKWPVVYQRHWYPSIDRRDTSL